MRHLLCLMMLLGVIASARAQIDTESIPPAQDQRDLFARAAASRLVIVGTVIKIEGVVPRTPPETSREHPSQSKDLRAILYTVQVEEIVCRQSDFDSAAPKIDERPQPFYLFIPFDESELPDGDYRESLLPKQRYLLLLHELDTSSLTAAYKLDPGRIYYRGEGHNRGVIPFAPETTARGTQNPPEVIDKFRKLCAAMRPPKPEDKLSMLQQLIDSGDPVLTREAENAKKSVRMNMPLNPPPETKPH